MRPYSLAPIFFELSWSASPNSTQRPIFLNLTERRLLAGSEPAPRCKAPACRGDRAVSCSSAYVRILVSPASSSSPSLGALSRRVGGVAHLNFAAAANMYTIHPPKKCMPSMVSVMRCKFCNCPVSTLKPVTKLIPSPMTVK